MGLSFLLNQANVYKMLRIFIILTPILLLSSLLLSAEISTPPKDDKLSVQTQQYLKDVYEKLKSGIALPSGAIFFMISGNCPTGTTDVTATYSNKFVRINATQATTGGADTHSHTLATANLPSHNHGLTGASIANESAHTHAPKFQSTAVPGGNAWIGVGGGTDSNDGSGSVLTNAASIGTGSAHTHALSGNTDSTGSGTAFTADNVPAFVTAKCCQVD